MTCITLAYHIYSSSPYVSSNLLNWILLQLLMLEAWYINHRTPWMNEWKKKLNSFLSYEKKEFVRKKKNLKFKIFFFWIIFIHVLCASVCVCVCDGEDKKNWNKFSPKNGNNIFKTIILPIHNCYFWQSVNCFPLLGLLSEE